MARFGLIPPASAAVRCHPPSEAAPGTPEKSPPQFRWAYPPQDGHRDPTAEHDSDTEDWSDESSDGSSAAEEGKEYDDGEASIVDESDSDEEEAEEEPPHPLGFEARYGRTRFGLSPQSVARMKPRDVFDGDDEHAWNALIRIDDRNNEGEGYDRQSFPPLGCHLRNGSVPTERLLRGAAARAREQEEGMDELLSGMDRIANLVKAAGVVQNDGGSRQGDSYVTPRAPFFPQSTQPAWTSPHSQPRSISKLLQLATACERRQAAVQSEMAQLQQQRDQSYKQSCQGFLLLLQADAARASSASDSISQRERRLRDLEEQERLEQEARAEQARVEREAAAKAEAERVAADAARTEEERIKERHRLEQLKAAEEEAEREAAKKTEHVSRATALIANLERVRAGLEAFDKDKSVGRRRLGFKKIVNGKINTLSHDARKVVEVGRLVSEAIANAANDDANGGGDPVAGTGKKYLLDLLCSNLIVRVQADGFNGTRGDGFPLANMFAQVSARCEEIGPVLEGHLYTVCPTAIPTLSLTSAREGEGDDELMESLGMLKDGEGNFESFDKFLNRTEGLISIMADIMASLPPEHGLLGGHAGALKWLRRFLDLLPPPPAAPLPLLTAPVLVAFLTGAGHMLANKYPDEFRRLFDTIKRDVEGRLDESPVGVPSATRLRKVLDDEGVEGLRREAPKGAVAGLYDGKAGGGGMGASPLQRSAAPATASAFGQASMGTDIGGNAFSSSDWGGSSVSSEGTGFGASSTASTAPMDNTTAAAPSPFGSGGFGSAPAPAPSPFGGGGPSSGFGAAPTGPTAGFATATAPTPSPFGSAGFGSSAPAPSPWGAATAAPAPSPFGASPGFGAPAAAASPSPFGAPATAPGPSPFGATPSSEGFGSFGAPVGSNQPNFQQPFGNTSAAPSPSPFGQGSSGGPGGTNKPPCKFFAQGKCNYGDRCKFSHDTGGGSNPSPFGNPAGSNQPANSAFGSSGGSKKQPSCKFFAEGKCRNGANCRFSHEQPAGGSGFGAQSSNPSPFGGGGSGSTFGGGGFGGQSTNPSPFGTAGGNAGGFGSSAFGASPSPFGGATPFGGPRR